MFSKLSLLQRIPIVFAFAMAFALVLGSNRIDRRQYAEIDSRITSVYKDRLLVQGYIYELNNIFHEKELSMMAGKTPANGENEKVDRLLTSFAATELTQDESMLLDEFIDLFEEFKKEEAAWKWEDDQSHKETMALAKKTLSDIHTHLDKLTKVQMAEGDRLTILSKDSLHMVDLLSHIQMAFMILLGIGILLLIFYPLKSQEEEEE